MSLTEKAVTKEEAKRLGAVPFSFPCRLDSEVWIVENMIRDFERANWKFVVVKTVFKSHSQLGDWEKPALELWKIN
jgi:hypothetical protein